MIRMGRLTERTKENRVYCGGSGDCPYENCYACQHFHDMMAKLAHYEDLEEAGRLVELPYKAGDTVWVILSEQQKVEVWEVYRIIFAKEHDHIEFINGMCFTVWDKDWTFAKKFLFHTRKEAEAALKGGGQE